MLVSARKIRVKTGVYGAIHDGAGYEELHVCARRQAVSSGLTQPLRKRTVLTVPLKRTLEITQLACEETVAVCQCYGACHSVPAYEETGGSSPLVYPEFSNP